MVLSCRITVMNNSAFQEHDIISLICTSI